MRKPASRNKVLVIMMGRWLRLNESRGKRSYLVTYLVTFLIINRWFSLDCNHEFVGRLTVFEYSFCEKSAKRSRIIGNYLEDKRKIPIFVHRTMDVFHLLGLGCPRSEELSGSWRLFFMPAERDRFSVPSACRLP